MSMGDERRMETREYRRSDAATPVGTSVGCCFFCSPSEADPSVIKHCVLRRLRSSQDQKTRGSAGSVSGGRPTKDSVPVAAAPCGRCVVTRREGPRRKAMRGVGMWRRRRRRGLRRWGGGRATGGSPRPASRPPPRRDGREVARGWDQTATQAVAPLSRITFSKKIQLVHFSSVLFPFRCSEA